MRSLGPSPEESLQQLLARFKKELSSNLDKARKWIWTNLGSHEKMDAVMYLRFATDMTFRDWLKLLGEVWTCCDNIGLYQDQILEELYEHLDNPLTVISELMDSEEITTFEALPEIITIYRGCGPLNKTGFSWTLNRDLAAQFPFNRRYETDQPTLLTATISKHRAAALKLDRNEQEIIMIGLQPTDWSEERLLSPTTIASIEAPADSGS